MSIKTYEKKYCQQLYKLFFDTVHTVNQKDYDAAQLDSWATLSPDLNKWCQPLQDSFSLIYFEKENILGFGNITETGYLDRLYVHKDHIGKGIGNKLVEQLEAYAKDLGLKEIVTHASITARPFFEKRGYQLIKEQTVARNNQHLTNYIMIKQLHKY